MITKEISYSTLTTLATSVHVYWCKHGNGTYDSWVGTDRYFAHCHIGLDKVADFEATLLQSQFEVASESDAFVLADLALGSAVRVPMHNAKHEAVVAPTHGYFEENARFKGFMLSASGVDTDTLLDHRIDQELFVHGGWYWSDGGELGDYAEFSVVDKDDVLGLFESYGLVSGVDVLELGKYVQTVYLKPGGSETIHLQTPTIAPVLEGLYMRTKLHTTSETPVHLGVTYLWFEV